MMRTKKLYYQDTYRKEFAGEVVSCRRAEKGWAIVLTETCFYPEGGGQPADQGILMPEKDQGLQVRVFDVQEEGEDLVHYTDRALEEGSMVRGRIDWNRRFDLMQQHSGEHIVSGLIHEEYGYDNVGFHMGADCITIDLSGPLNMDQAAAIQNRANRYIWQDDPVHILLPEKEELDSLDYRSKKDLSGQVRLVSFPGADLCACCGLHVSSAGQIGMVLILSVKKFRQGVRIEMLSGGRAFSFMEANVRENSRIASALSVKHGDTFDAVGRLQQEIYALKGERIRDRRRQAESCAKRCRGLSHAAVIISGLDSGDLPSLTDSILDQAEGMGAVFSGDDKEGYKYALGLRDGDVRDLAKDMNQSLSGRGGGRPGFVQGSLKTTEDELAAFLSDRGFTLVRA